MQNVPELMVSQAQMKKNEAKEEKETKKVEGWSTKMLEDVKNKPEFEDTEEMVQERGIHQEEADNLRKELREKMEEEAVEKYQAEETTPNACEGRGEPTKWQIKNEGTNVSTAEVERGSLGCNFSLFGEYSFQRNRSVQAGQTEEEAKLQNNIEVMKSMTRQKVPAQCRIDAQNSWLVSALLAAAFDRAWINSK